MSMNEPEFSNAQMERIDEVENAAAAQAEEAAQILLGGESV